MSDVDTIRDALIPLANVSMKKRDDALAALGRLAADNENYAGYGEILGELTARAEAAEAVAERMRLALEAIETFGGHTSTIARAALAAGEPNG
jgi:hypothetical protein